MTGLLAGGLAGAAIALVLAPRPRHPERMVPRRQGAGGGDWVRRGRWWWAVCAGTACWSFVPGSAGLLAGLAAAVVVHRLAARAEPASVRREREELRRDLPVAVLLLATTLRTGAAPGAALRRVCAALPGAAADRLAGVPDRLALGLDAATVWGELTQDPELAPLGRAMARSHRSGAPVATTVARVADELAATARAELEDRARAVGVRAALPLGLCLLPSFLLLGIAPLVAGLVAGLRL